MLTGNRNHEVKNAKCQTEGKTRGTERIDSLACICTKYFWKGTQSAALFSPWENWIYRSIDVEQRLLWK